MDDCRGNLTVCAADGDRVIRLSDGALTIGRRVDNDVVLADVKVSRHHLRLTISADRVELNDLGSSGGTEVNGVPVTNATLADGSEVRIGDTLLRFELFSIVPSEHPRDPEYIQIEAGADEPTIVETVLPGELTLTHDGLQQDFHDVSAPRLAVFAGSGVREIPLKEGNNTIGRSDSCDIVISDDSASRQHACVERTGDRFILRDLDSKNGTWLREARIKEQMLFDGVNFRIGTTFCVFKAGIPSGSSPQPLERSERTPVVVLPGLMGSELFHGDTLFWPNISRALRNLEVMTVGGEHTLTLGGIAKEVVVVPGFLKLDAYSELVRFLEEELGYQSGADLLEFPYDWRQDNRDSAEKLKVAIDRWRRDVIGMDTKFIILCHSMGALVSRYYMNCLGGESNVIKFISLAGAHFGAPFAIRGILYGPDLLPLGIGRKPLHSALLSMPSAYQLVPPHPTAFRSDGSPIDLHADDSWTKPEYRHLLRSARDFHAEIGSSVRVPTTCIFGYGVKTITRIIVDELDEAGWKKARFLIEPSGDNRVVDRYGYLEGADIHPVKQHHGSLWNDKDVKMRIRLELAPDQAISAPETQS